MSVAETVHPSLSRAPPRQAHGRLDLARYVFPMLLFAYVIFVPLGLDLFENPLVSGRPYGLVGTLYGNVRYIGAPALTVVLLLTATVRRSVMATWPLWPFVLFALLSALFSPLPKEAFGEWRNLAASLVWVPAFVGLVGLPRLARSSAIITTCVSICSFLAAILPPHIGVHHITDASAGALAGNWRGIFIHKNVCGEVSVTSLVFSLRNLRNERGLWKAFFWTGRIAAVVVLVMSRSANGLAGGVAACVFIALMSSRQTSRPVALLGIGGIAALAAYGLSLSTGSFLNIVHKDPTFTGRTIIWALGMKMIKEHLWFGHGFATDDLIFGPVAKSYLFESAVDLHDGYLDVVFNIGLVGAALLIVTAAFIIGRAYLAALSERGVRRETLIIYMTLFVSACTMALGETSPFRVLGDGAITFWFSLVVLSADRLNSHVYAPKRVRRARQLRRLSAQAA